MHVRCYNIKFAEKASEISVIGADALANFMEPVYREFYGKGYVDTKSTDNIEECDVEVDLPDDWLDDLDFTESRIKQVLEKKIGFKVKSFNYRIRG